MGLVKKQTPRQALRLPVFVINGQTALHRSMRMSLR